MAKENEERYRVFFSTTNEGFALHELICDVSGKPYDFRYLETNEAFNKITGLPRDKIIGKRATEVLPILDPLWNAPFWIKTFSRVVLTGEPIYFEDYRPSVSKWSRIYAFSPQKNQFAVLISDITESKLAEEALKESESRFRLALKNAPVSISAQDCDLHFLWAYNQRSIQPADVTGKTDFDFFALQDAEKLINLKQRVLQTGTEINEKMWITSNNGQRAFIDLFLEPIKDEAGRVKAIGIATVDLTRMKRMEEQIQVERDKLITILNSMEDGVCIMNCDLDLEYINPSMRTQFGDIDGKKCYQYFNGRDEMCPWCNNKDVIVDGQTLRRESHSNKTGKTYEITDTPLDNSNGAFLKLAVFHDITERKKIEQLKDEFIGMVSHELKTPLTVIMGALLTATDERVSAEQVRELLGDAVLNTEILSNIIDNLLELSRQQSGRLILQTQSVNILEVTHKVILKLQQKSAKHKLIVDIPSELSPASGDALRIERILYNLVDNAIKYSPAGGEVKITAYQDGDQLLVIGVRDQGPGISREDQSRLFQSFERLETKVNRNIQGTGLGLRVCRILVEAHQGRIWVESEKDKGSTFYFTLPVVKSVKD